MKERERYPIDAAAEYLSQELDEDIDTDYVLQLCENGKLALSLLSFFSGGSLVSYLDFQAIVQLRSGKPVSTPVSNNRELDDLLSPRPVAGSRHTSPLYTFSDPDTARGMAEAGLLASSGDLDISQAITIQDVFITHTEMIRFLGQSEKTATTRMEPPPTRAMRDCLDGIVDEIGSDSTWDVIEEIEKRVNSGKNSVFYEVKMGGGSKIIGFDMAEKYGYEYRAVGTIDNYLRDYHRKKTKTRSPI